MCADKVTFVVHIDDLEALELSSAAELEYHEPCGPLGFNRYSAVLEELNVEKLKDLNAVAYYFEIDEEVIREYNEEHLLEMFKMFLGMRIGAQPDGFQTLRFEETRVRHYYPIYRSQYLYLGKSERQLLCHNVLLFLGLYPVSANPKAWHYQKLTNPVDFEGACVVRSTGLIASQLDKIETLHGQLAQEKLQNVIVIKTQL